MKIFKLLSLVCLLHTGSVMVASEKFSAAISDFMQRVRQSAALRLPKMPAPKTEQEDVNQQGMLTKIVRNINLRYVDYDPQTFVRTNADC